MIRLELCRLYKINSARLIHALDPYILNCVIMKLNYLVLWVLYLIMTLCDDDFILWVLQLKVQQLQALRMV